MHCRLQVITKGKPSYEDISAIMDPYYEEEFYDKFYDPERDEYRDIPPVLYPAFLWDYWDIWYQNPIDEVEIGECFAIIDKQKRPHVRKRWNGRVHEDHQKDFDYWVKRVIREKGANDWVTTIDYHY